MPRQLRSKAGGVAEMVEKVGVGLADARSDRLQGDRLRPLLDQKRPRRCHRRGTTFFLGQANARY